MWSSNIFDKTHVKPLNGYVAYGSEEEAAYYAYDAIIGEIEAVDVEVMGVLLEGGGSVLIELLFLLL